MSVFLNETVIKKMTGVYWIQLREISAKRPISSKSEKIWQEQIFPLWTGETPNKSLISLKAEKTEILKVGVRKTAVIDFKSSSEAQNFRYSLLRKMSLYWSFYVGKYRFPSQNKIFCRKLGFFMDNFFCFGWYSGQVNDFREKSHIFRILKV